MAMLVLASSKHCEFVTCMRSLHCGQLALSKKKIKLEGGSGKCGACQLGSTISYYGRIRAK